MGKQHAVSETNVTIATHMSCESAGQNLGQSSLNKTTESDSRGVAPPSKRYRIGRNELCFDNQNEIQEETFRDCIPGPHENDGNILGEI